MAQELDEEDEDWVLPGGVDPLLAATELYSETTAQVGRPARRRGRPWVSQLTQRRPAAGTMPGCRCGATVLIPAHLGGGSGTLLSAT